MKIELDTAERNPLYAGSMCLDDVDVAVTYLTYNLLTGNFLFPLSQLPTFLSKPHVAPGRHLMARSTEHDTATIRNHAFLDGLGIAPADWGQGSWHPQRFSVKVTERSIVQFRDWLRREALDHDAANHLEQHWPEWFTETSNDSAPEDGPIVIEVPEGASFRFELTINGLTDKSEVEIENLGGKLTLVVTDPMA